MSYYRFAALATVAGVALVALVYITQSRPLQSNPGDPEPSPQTPEPARQAQTASSGSNPLPLTEKETSHEPSPVDQWRRTVMQSNDPDDAVLLGAIYVGEQSGGTFLIDALALAPNNAMLHFYITEHCLYLPDDGVCSIGAIDRLGVLDPDNAAVDVTRAIEADALFGPAKALEILKAGLTKSEYNEYTGEFVATLGDSLRRGGVPFDSKMIETVTGQLAGLASARDHHLSKLCQTHAEDRTWRDTCYQYGHKLWANASNDFNYAAGIGLVRETSDDPEEAAKLIRQWHQKRDASGGAVDQLMMYWSMQPNWQMTETQWQQFVTDIKHRDTHHAFINLRDSVLPPSR